MRFEELIQQHRVYLFITDGQWLALVVSHDQLRVHLRYFLCDQAKMRHSLWVEFFLVTEAHRMQGENRFARLVHRFDRFLKPRRGGPDTELPIVGDADCYRCAMSNPCVPNPSDVGGCLGSYRADADGAGFICNTIVAD